MTSGRAAEFSTAAVWTVPFSEPMERRGRRKTREENNSQDRMGKTMTGSSEGKRGRWMHGEGGNGTWRGGRGKIKESDKKQTTSSLQVIERAGDKIERQ